MTAKIASTGLPELDAKLRALGGRLSETILRDAMMEAARPYAETTAARAERDSGLIGNSIKAVNPKQGGTLSKTLRAKLPEGALVVVGASELDARHLEYGTVYTEPQPFARPTYESEAGAVRDRFVAAVKARLK